MTMTPTVTRQELAGYLEETFELLGLVERHNVINALRRGGASDETIALVAERVPEGVRMTELRVLWHYLGDVPVDRQEP